MHDPAPKKIVGGLERRHGLITKTSPVEMHDHNNGHWFTACGPDLICVETQHHGTFNLNAGQSTYIWAKERHRMTVYRGKAHYTCVGVAPL